MHELHTDRPDEGRPIADPLTPPTVDAAADAARIDPVATTTVRTATPSRLRIGLVGGAAVALAIGAVTTAMAGSPTPTSSGTAAPAAVSGFPAALLPDELGAGLGDLDHGRFGGMPGHAITIEAISGDQVTLATNDGWRRTITLTDAVDLTKGGIGIEPSDLAVGDQVRVAQERSDDGTYTVTAIAVVVPTIRGEVGNVSASGFTVTTRDGSVWTIATDSETQYRYGTAEGSASDLVDGVTVVVLGESTGDNAIDATTVRVAPARVAGEVTAVDGDSITIRNLAGTSVTIAVDGETTFRVRGVEAAALDDIQVGMVLGAAGRSTSDTTLEADVVVAGEGAGRGWFRGERGPGGAGGRGDRAAPFGGFGPLDGFGPWGDDVPEDGDATPSTTS